MGASQPEGTIKTVRIGPIAQSEDINQFEDGQIRLLWDGMRRRNNDCV